MFRSNLRSSFWWVGRSIGARTSIPRGNKEINREAEKIKTVSEGTFFSFGAVPGAINVDALIRRRNPRTNCFAREASEKTEVARTFAARLSRPFELSERVEATERNTISRSRDRRRVRDAF